jgi:hypothetical protein
MTDRGKLLRPVRIVFVFQCPAADSTWTGRRGLGRKKGPLGRGGSGGSPKNDSEMATFVLMMSQSIPSPLIPCSWPACCMRPYVFAQVKLFVASRDNIWLCVVSIGWKPFINATALLCNLQMIGEAHPCLPSNSEVVTRKGSHKLRLHSSQPGRNLLHDVHSD